MRSEHRKLMPLSLMNRLSEYGIEPMHVTAPGREERDWNNRLIRRAEDEHRFSLMPASGLPVSIGAYMVKEDSVRLQQRVLHYFINPHTASPEDVDLLEQNPIYDLHDFNYALDLMADAVAARGYDPVMLGSLLTYIACVQRTDPYATGGKIEHYLTLIQRGVDLANFERALRKRMPIEMILDNPGIPLNLLLEMY